MLFYLVSFLLGIVTVLVVQHFSGNRKSASQITPPPYSYVVERVNKVVAEAEKAQNEQPQPQPRPQSESQPQLQAQQPQAPPRTLSLQQTIAQAQAQAQASPLQNSQSGSGSLVAEAKPMPLSPKTASDPVKRKDSINNTKFPAELRAKSGNFLSALTQNPFTPTNSLGKYFQPPGNPVLQGWLEIRAVSMVWNKRFFVLYVADDDGQGWMTYFKNEQMKRSDCYGHIKVKNCAVKPYSGQKYGFEVVNTQNRCVFSVDGPPSLLTPASASHRIFRLSSTSCLFRAADAKIADEWTKAIESAVKATLSNDQQEEEEEDALEPKVDEILRMVPNQEDASPSGAPIQPLNVSPELPTAESTSSSSSSGYSEPVPTVPEVQRTEVEQRAIRILREKIPELIEERQIDDGMLCRFSKARAYEPKATIEMLTNYFNWRDEYKPELIDPSQIMEEITKQKAYFYGYDKFDRPLLIVWAARHVPKNSDLEYFMKLIIYLLEQSIANMKPPISQFTAIIDLRDWGKSNFDLNTVKVAAHMLQSFYPERLGAVLLVNTPWLLKSMWGLINPFLDERTRKKIRFLDNVGQLVEFKSTEELPRAVNGTSDYVPKDTSVGLETLQPGFSFAH